MSSDSTCGCRHRRRGATRRPRCFCQRVLPAAIPAIASMKVVSSNFLSPMGRDEMIFVLKMYAPEESASETTNGDKSKPVLDDEASHRPLTETPTKLFVINPAGVVSAAPNFESPFALLTYAGHEIAAGGRCR